MTSGDPPLFIDTLNSGEEIHFVIRSVLYEARSAHQEIRILDLERHGRTLILDGNMQSSERDEFLYHEALIHPALLLVAAPGPRSVLILGGGEGATLREVLRYPSLEKAVMVDLDQQVVEACREHLPGHHAGAFDDPRCRLLFQDAEEFLKQTEDRFDAIVFDIVDPVDDGPASHLFEAPFFELMKTRLEEGGVFTMQYGPAFLDRTCATRAVLERLDATFDRVFAGRIFVPSFHGAWGIAIGFDHPTDLEPAELDRRIAARLTHPPRSLDGAGIVNLLQLPRHLRDELGR